MSGGEPTPPVPMPETDTEPRFGPDLTEGQRKRLDAIKDEIGKLTTEAEAIIQPTAYELWVSAESYADCKSWELAMDLVDGWNKPWEALETRDMLKEESEAEEEANNG